MRWFEVPKPTQQPQLVDDSNPDAMIYRDDTGEQLLHLFTAGGALIDRWYQGVRDDEPIDCARFPCPLGGKHSWDEPAITSGVMPATSGGTPVHFCSKCGNSEDDLRGELEAHELTQIRT